VIVDALGARLGVSYSPAGDTAVVALHGASDGTRDHFLLRNLHAVLPRLGVGVATYDRRGEGESTGSPSAGNFDLQAEDAICVARSLGVSRIGLWGFSQGAWVAPIAAESLPATGFLVLVSSAAVSPARQMNFGVAEQLRRAGYPASVIEVVGSMRDRFATWAGGAHDSRLADDLAAAEREPWWTLAYLPAGLPDEADRTAWHKEMSFDPLPIYSRIRVPTLIVYGGDDMWVSVDESTANWASLDVPGLKSVVIPNAKHDMSTQTGEPSAEYEGVLRDWITELD
jgi:uncharacterized protein